MYHNDIFYKVETLDFQERKNILLEAKEKAYKVNIDIKPSNSWTRENSTLSFEEIMYKFDASCHFVIIYRRGYEEYKMSEIWSWKVEIGFSTMSLGDAYYLFIYLKEEEIEFFIKKYNLKML